MYSIWRWGSEEQKQRWLPAMHAGESIGCFGLTEPDAGSDPGSMRTTARRDGSDWILNGAKMWITNGTIADVATVWARTEDGKINGFLVEKGTPGFSAPEIHKKLSLRASVTSELVLADVRVPEENRFPEVDTLRGPLSCLNEARYGIVWGRGRRRPRLLRGGARLREGTDRLREADRGLPAHAREARRDGPRAEPRHAGGAPHRPDEGSGHPPSGARQPRQAGERPRRPSRSHRSARTILGANGVTLEYPVIRHVNNLESVLTYEGTHEVHTLVVGNALTGENAFR